MRRRKEFARSRNAEGTYSLSGYDRLKCIFIHIPKTGGVSVNKTLFGNFGGGHITRDEYKRIFGPNTFRKYFKFTFVRNPYSRLLSAYLFLKNGGFNKVDKTWADKNISIYETFNDFVFYWVNENNIYSYIHFKPQYSFVCDRNYKPDVDFIGRFEYIDSDFKKVCEKLGVSKTLGTFNASGLNRDWKTFYNEKSLEIVSNVYRFDFEIFDYTKKPFVETYQYD